MNEIQVIKRNGEKEPLDIAKIQKQIAYACDGITGVSPSMVEIAAQIQFYNNMTTADIDKLLLHAMVNLINEEENPEINNVNYQYVAGRQRLAMLRKEVYNSYTVPSLYEIVKRNVENKMYTPELLDWYTEEEWDLIDGFIDHSKDEKLPFAAIEQFITKYLVQNRAIKKVFETPQIRYAIAAAVIYHNESEKRLNYIKDFYKLASDGAFTLATPVLAGLGTNTKQFSSCVVLRTDDNLDSIFSTGEMVAKYSSKRAGIGLEIGRMRGLEAPIRNGEVSHTGIVPFIKKWFADMRSCSQGSIRNSSMTINCPIWHIQFDDFIVLKNNQGTEETRVRYADYCVALSGFFWRRFKNEENITFFDPNEVPDLYEAFYKDTQLFEELYLKYEKKRGLRTKVVPAVTVFKDWLLKERTDTGRIYLMFVDNIINQTPFDVKEDPVYQTNLCAEILIPSKPFNRLDDESGEIGLCTLSSINWGYFKKPEDMKKACNIIIHVLNNILDYQDFLSIQSANHNKRFKPLGVGITNLAYWHAKRGFEYGENDSLAEVKRWMEYQNYFLLDATVRMAEERGPCEKSNTSTYQKGIFQWEKRAIDVDELTDFTPNPDINWEELRERMIKFGVHNMVQIAIAPVESSSVVINSTNGMELPMALISTKESKTGGSLVQVVPEYQKLGRNYQLLWEQKDCINYIKTAAVLNVYTDQSISTNTFYSPKHFEKFIIPATLIASNLMDGFRWGIKTYYYSLMEKTGNKEDLNEDLPYREELEDDEACSACVL